MDTILVAFLNGLVFALVIMVPVFAIRWCVQQVAWIVLGFKDGYRSALEAEIRKKRGH